MKKAIQFCNGISIWLSGLTLFLMMLLTASDVFGRYLFKHPINGANDFTELMMVIIIFLGLSDTASTDGHIRVEFITSRLTFKNQRRLKIVTLFMSDVVAAVLTWRLAANACYVYLFPENTLVLELPKLPFIAIAAIGCGLLTMVLVVTTYDTFKQIRGNVAA